MVKIKEMSKLANLNNNYGFFLNNLNKIITTKHTEKSSPFSPC